MSAESQRLREAIRIGLITCRCGAVPDAIHRQGCMWEAAVLKVYELERAEEANENGQREKD